MSSQIHEDGRVFYAQLTSCAVRYDVIYNPSPVNSQYLNTSGVDSPECIPSLERIKGHTQQTDLTLSLYKSMVRRLCHCSLRSLRFHLTATVRILTKGAVTRDDSQRWFFAQHSTAMLEECWKHSKQCRNNVAMLNRRCESSHVLITLKRRASTRFTSSGCACLKISRLGVLCRKSTKSRNIYQN